MLELFRSVVAIVAPIFVISTMLNVGLTQRLSDITGHLKNSPFVLKMLLANFVLDPRWLSPTAPVNQRPVSDATKRLGYGLNSVMAPLLGTTWKKERQEDRAMPDPIARKRLKKKMLDRWENEGGSIAADPVGSDDTRPTGEHKGEAKQLSASRNKSMVSGPASPAKRRKLTRN